MAQKDPKARAAYQANWYAKNRQQVRAAQKAWRESQGGAKHRFGRTLRKYGITEVDWDRLWLSQGGKCAGCLCTLLLGNQTHIDHCHSSNRVRGLLCSECNLALGKVSDSVDTLKRLCSYLERSEAVSEVATWQG